MAERPAAPHKERKWTPLLGVLAVGFFITFGGYVVAGPLEEPLPSTPETVQVVPGLSVTPAPGWAAAGTIEIPVGDAGDVLGGVRFNRGTGNLDVFVVDNWGGSDEDLYFAYVIEILQPAASQLRYSDALDPFATDQGVEGVRGYYVGAFTGVSSPIEGEVATTIGPGGLGVIFDGWSQEGQLTRWIDDIRAMVATSEVS